MTTNGGKILIVDDDPGMLRLLSLRLGAAGHDVSTCERASDALQRLTVSRPDLVLTDLRMDEMDGIGLLNELSRRAPGLPVLIITAHGTIPDAVTATQQGAFGFLTKPIDKGELLSHVDRALSLSAPFGESQQWRSHIVSRSTVMEELLAKAKRVAATSSSVLIGGESGTGKELLARAIHNASGRSGAFVAVHCSAIPHDLLESELFGHAKGAFTGAVNERKGLLQAADGGTLFLDEIGDMPAFHQVKLLRSLQDGQLRPVGSDKTTPVDLRVIAATHRDLQSAVREGRFREDLYYRLNVVSLKIPSLAARREDIPLLINRKLDQLAVDGATRRGFSPKAMELLIAAEWPGNVRQLFNVVEKTVALSTTPVISASLVKAELGGHVDNMPSYSDARDEFSRKYLVDLLRLCRGNVSKAARLARRNRTDFYKLLARHGIDWSQFKSEDTLM